jgi:hypothetical protein
MNGSTYDERRCVMRGESRTEEVFGRSLGRIEAVKFQ